jgi:hypothetical protein
MSAMKRWPLPIGAVAWALLAAPAAYAQSPNNLVGGSQFNPPLPAPLPPPRIEAPAVPKLDAPPSYDYRPAPRPSFSDKVARCLDEGAAEGLGPADRAAYSRSCANR